MYVTMTTKFNIDCNNIYSNKGRQCVDNNNRLIEERIIVKREV